MIKSIELRHEERNFFGVTQDHWEKLEGFVRREHVLKAMNYIIKKDNDAVVCIEVHDDVMGNSSEIIFQEYDQRGTDMVTWKHCYGKDGQNEYSSKLTIKEIKRISRNWEE